MLSVLIVNWNTRDLLRDCLASIRDSRLSEPIEVIVVDNVSADESAQMIASEFPEVKLIASTHNLGYAAGNNAAFDAATGEWLLTLNPDVRLAEDTLALALQELDQNPRFGALSVKLKGEDGRTQRSVRGFPSFLGLLGDVTGLAGMFPRSKLGSYRLPAFDYETAQEAPQPMGTFLLFRRQALEAVGNPRKPFDESFPIFFNEVDLLYRMRRRGWPALYSPRTSLVHLGGASTRQVRKNMIWESHRSLARFMRKHYRTRFNAPGLWLLSGLIMLSAMVRARGVYAGFRP